MRVQFFLVPAALVAAMPAQARVFMDVAQAQQTMFPGADMIELPISASTALTTTRTWKVTSGGWLIVDQVEVKGDIITYAVALDAQGVLQRLEILECAADYDTVTMPRWRKQFVGRPPYDELRNIRTITGATLSSREITEGVRRILATRRPA